MPRASHEMDLDSFLGHRGSAGGSTGYLEKWRDDGSVDVFIHPAAGVAALWGHGWYRIADYKKKDEQIVEVRSMRCNCLESEAVLTRQKYRDHDDRRETPPTICPMCIALEHVRDLVNDGKLSWVEPIFKFEVPDDPSQPPTTITAGGWTKLIADFGNDLPKKKDQYTKEQKEMLGELREASIQLNEVFREEGFARLQYLMSVVAVADPGQGCVLTFEAQALGDAVKKVIRNQIMSLGPKGDPRVNPYAFRWLYDANKSFSAKYDAVAMPLIEVTPAIAEVLNTPPPSIASHVLPLNVRQMRASMEEHCLIELPWDQIFAPAMEIADELEAEAKAAGERRDDEATSFAYGAGTTSDSSAAAEPDEEVECAHCNLAMLASQSTCPHCDAKYLPDGSMVPPPPPKPAAPASPPPLRSRSAVAAAKTAPAGSSAPQSASAPPAAAGGAAKPPFRASTRRRAPA